MKTRTPESLQEPLLGLTGYVLRRASTAALGEFSHKLASLDLRPTDAALLVLIDAAPEVTHSEAAETLGLRRPNLVPVVAGLEKRGLIARSPDPHDSRAKRAVATPEGIALVEEVRAVGRVVYEHAMRGISATERKQLLDMLSRMKENVLAMNADQKELVE